MEQKNTKSSRRPRRNKYAAPVGAAYLLLAVIGVVAVIYGSIQLTSKVLDNSKEVEQLERMLMPVLMFDPVPFDNIADADPLMVLQSSLWSTLYSDKRESYTYDDNGSMVVPASDVEVAATKLFGPDVKLTHTTFGDLENTFTYDEENAVYRVPMMAQAGYYTPDIDGKDIVKKGDLLEIKVGYVSPGAAWSTDSQGNKYQPTPDKYMIYQVKKTKNDYYIVALKDPGDVYTSGPQHGTN